MRNAVRVLVVVLVVFCCFWFAYNISGHKTPVASPEVGKSQKVDTLRLSEWEYRVADKFSIFTINMSERNLDPQLIADLMGAAEFKEDTMEATITFRGRGIYTEVSISKKGIVCVALYQKDHFAPTSTCCMFFDEVIIEAVFWKDMPMPDGELRTVIFKNSENRQSVEIMANARVKVL